MSNIQEQKFSENFLDQMGQDTTEPAQPDYKVVYKFPENLSEEDRQEIEKYALKIKEKAGEVVNLLDGYEDVKDKLIIRPVWNKKIQNGKDVYKLISGDIALVLYAIVLDDRENGILNTIRVPSAVFKGWGITKDVVFDEILRNTMEKAEPRMYTNIFNIADTPEYESAFMSKDFKNRKLNPDNVALVTTNRKTNGAIAMFYPGVKEKLAEMFDDSFFIAFTSIHEAMIHKRGSIEPVSIKRNVTETNRIFGPEDTLSDSIFYYDRETKEFSPWEI